MGLDPVVCLSDPLYGVDPGITAECDEARAALETETHDTGTVPPSSSPEDSAAAAAAAAVRLRKIEAHEAYVADRVPLDTMHPAGAPRSIGMGSISVAAWEVEGSEYANLPSGSEFFHNVDSETTPISFTVVRYEGRTFLVSESQPDHHLRMIANAAERGRPLTITDRSGEM